ncbi:hypothetical protein ACO1O0_007755 [Amphichorda felina]
MGKNILITGAAGYIGGSIVANFISRIDGPIKSASISAAARSADQVQTLSKLGVNAILVDLNDENSVKAAILSNSIDIIVHTASSSHPSLVANLINALGERQKISGETSFVHSSITTLFSVDGGWPHGEIADTDDVFTKEKELGGPHPVRQTNILLAERAKALGIKSFNVAVPNVYGRGSGSGRKVSVNIPANIRAAMEKRTVYIFDKDGASPAAHISDLAELYALLVEKILLKEPIPSGEKGYYFAMSHQTSWWTITKRLAEAMYARGLVDSPEVKTWPSYDEAADALGFPRLHVRAMGTASATIAPVNAYKIGWQPKWDEKRFLDNIDEEVRDVLEVDSKPTLFSSMLPSKN